MSADKPSSQNAGEAANSTPNTDRILFVDQIWSKKDLQNHFVKTAHAGKHAKRFRKYDLVVRRVITAKGLFSHEEIDIKSEKLATVLRDICRGVQGIKLNQNPPEISPWELFHAFRGLEDRAAAEKIKQLPDTATLDDINLALEFIRNKFATTFENLRAHQAHSEITWDLLWAIFPTGSTVISESNVLKETEASKVVRRRYEEDPEDLKPTFFLTCQILQQDRGIFGWGEILFKVKEFEGARSISGLPMIPIQYRQNSATLLPKLRERGKKYVQLMETQTLQEYTDWAVFEEVAMNTEPTERVFMATGRIMPDPTAFSTQNPDAVLLHRPRVNWDKRVSSESLADDDFVFCSHRIQGYAFDQNRWAAFAVSKTKPIIWSEDAFDKLIFEEKKKELIRLLVSAHRAGDNDLDDIIKGKGKGLVGLLTGSPGVGKTLTAEAVAEVSKRPLYAVSAGELGTEVSKADQVLASILDIAKRWNCVLLLDEADVFLCRRTEGDLQRNALVSLFLRRLEYFQGIVLLTTNRKQEIDEAFKSRIHFTFQYPALNENDRLVLWKNFLGEACKTTGCPMPDTEELRGLAKQELNGREIKNIVLCAASIVRASSGALTAHLVTDVLEVLKDKI